MEHKLYLSKRNIETLMSKLNRVAKGDSSACTISKRDNEHPRYPQTMSECAITAVEEYHGGQTHYSQIYLTRKNLENLLTGNPFLFTLPGEDTLVLMPILDDEAYYAHRDPGYVLPVDNPKKV
jgi:hypothetical protein